ncbi:MAG: hypothetical protein Q9186_000910 [Xanthomendoza sp. 1 TL-2023]
MTNHAATQSKFLFTHTSLDTTTELKDVVYMASTEQGFGQPIAGFATSRNHPRHLPTPIISSTANMSFRNRSVSEILEPRRQRNLPSLGQVFDEHDRATNLLTPHPDLDFERSAAQHQGSVHAGTTQISAARAAEVMQKSFETMRAQIYANGFTDEDIRKAREADVVAAYAEASKEVTPDDEMEEEADEDYEPNPYQDRADEIGLSHRIPGIGHLGDLLTPPHWKSGDEPIPPKRSRQLQREAHDAAKKRLTDSISGFKDLKGVAFQEASDLKNEEWQKQSELTKLVFEERVKVYKAHQERKEQQPQAGQELPGKQSSVLRLPYPKLSSLQDHSGGVTESNHYVYGRHASRIDSLSCQSGLVSRPSTSLDQPEPSPKVMSPSFLDPSLIPGTVDAVLRNYHAKKDELQKLQLENELQMKQCLTKYGPRLGPGHPPIQQAQSVPRFLGQEFQPEKRTQPASQQQQLPYYAADSQLGTETDGANGDERKEDIGPTTYRYASPPGQEGLGIYEDRGDEPVELALSSPIKQTNDEWKARQPSQPTSQTTDKSAAPSKKSAVGKGTPRMHPATSRYAREKKPVWYASHLETANLPTSTLSNSALEAGLAYDPKAPPPPKVNDAGFPVTTTTKKRRRLGDEVPIPEFKMPAEKIRAMFASGLPMKYVGKGPNPYLMTKTEGSVVDEQGEPVAKKKKRSKGKVKVSSLAKVKTLSNGNDTPTVRDVDADSCPSSSDGDDDDDGDATYGRKAKTGTPKKAASMTSRKMKAPRVKEN